MYESIMYIYNILICIQVMKFVTNFLSNFANLNRPMAKANSFFITSNSTTSNCLLNWMISGS